MTISTTISTNRESDRFMLRLPDGMRERIKAAAETNGRSMNAEIVAALEKAYPAKPAFEELVGYAKQLALMQIQNPTDASIKQLSSLLEAVIESAEAHGYLELPPPKEEAN